MAELIVVRLTLFLVAFFALQRLLPRLIAKPQRWHGLIALAVATLIAFVIAALLLGDSMAESLVAWALITLAIAIIWFVRWKTMDYERTMRRPREAPDAPSEPL
jgi:nucleoside permease NupC